MSWNDVIISVCSIILTALASWASTMLIAWLNEKLKGTKSERYVMEAYRIVEECVKVTYQTYVEAIKGTELWTKEAQEHALQMALESAKSQLNSSTTKYIAENFGGVDEYLVGLIEAIIYDLKKRR